MDALRRKSIALTGYMEFLFDEKGLGKFSVITPREPERRGAQLSICVPRNGRAVCERLMEHGVLCDWREPDILRVAPAPLYNTFGDVHGFVEKFVAEIR